MEHKRNCPVCDVALTYSTVGKLNRAIKNNVKCKSCVKMGSQNPMYGRTGSMSPRFNKPGMIGDSNPSKRKDVREKISAAKKGMPSGMTGKRHSKETIDKIAKSNTGLKRSETTCENIRNAVLRNLEKGLSNNPYARKQYYKNTGIHYQGTYELHFLEKYMQQITIQNGKTFYYELNGKRKAYISDFFIPEYNLIIEIKSSWTYKLKGEQIELKRNAVINAGFDYILVMDKEYADLDLLIQKRGSTNGFPGSGILPLTTP